MKSNTKKNASRTNTPIISIYIPCHKPAFVPNVSLFKPIQVGAAIAEKRLSGMIFDDIGTNISKENKKYCELTAQYWAWKNDLESDYYGFFHYRRYLNFSVNELQEDGWGDIEYKEQLNEEMLKELGINDDNMRRIITQFDIIVPKRREINDNKTIYEQYITSYCQYKEDIDLFLEVLLEKYPEYYEAAHKYLNSHEAYECNMFIMNKELFQSYQSWLFDLLFEMDSRSDYSDYNETELRALAYLGERMFGVWLTYTLEHKSIKKLELQKSLFRKTDERIKFNNFDNGKINIVLSSNDYYCPYMSTTIQSICENTNKSKQYSIYILTRDLTDEKIQRLNKQVSQYNNVSVSVINVDNYLEGKSFFVDQHISIETYYRLFIPEIFVGLSKVIYIDCDLVVNRDLALLYDIDVTNYFVGAVRDVDVEGTAKRDSLTKDYIDGVVGCTDKLYYFQAGVILLNLDRIRKYYSSTELVKLAQKEKWKYWDQDVLNTAFKGNVLYLPQNWNVIMNWDNGFDNRMNTIKCAPYSLYNEYLKARKDPYICHYAGYQKPWDITNCDFSTYFWKYARHTLFYEEIMERLSIYHTRNIATELQNHYPRECADSRVIDYQGVKVNGIDDALYVDGVLVRFINMINRKYPLGSKKRNRMKKIARLFVK